MRWIWRRRRSWIVGTTAMVAGMIVSLGLLATVRQSHTSALPALRRVRVFGTTLWVPPTWRKSMSANARLQSQTITFTSRIGQLTLTRCRFMGFLPLVGNVPRGAFLSEKNGPYVISWRWPSTYIAETSLPSGAGLTLQMTQMHRSDGAAALIRRMLTRVRFPVPLTVTQAVAGLRRSPVTQTATLTQRILDREGRYRAWLFVSGAPLGDMSAWTPSYLFRTTNGGTTWQLIDYACSGEFGVCPPPGHRHFLGQATPVVLKFLSPSVGILAQPNRIAPSLKVYRTTDGGLQWTTHSYPLPNLPNLSSTAPPPQITETATGRLTITIAVHEPSNSAQSMPVTYGSTNQGRTWHPVPSTEITPSG